MALSPPLPVMPAARLWKERHAHRYLSLAQNEDGQIWVLVQDVRQWTRRLPPDSILAQRHPHALARCDDTRRVYLQAEELVKLLSGQQDVAVLKLLNWLEAFVLRPARQRAEWARTDPRYRLQRAEPELEAESTTFWASCQSLVRPSHWDPRIWRISTGVYGLRRTFLAGLSVVFLTLGLSSLIDELAWNVEKVYVAWTWVAIALVVWAGIWNLAWLLGGLRAAVRRNLEGLPVGLAALGAIGNGVVAVWSFGVVLGMLSASLSIFKSYYVDSERSIQTLVMPGPDGLDTAPMLYLKGKVGVGSTLALKAALEENPDIRRVVLRSPGGLIVEGMGMAQLVKTRQLETVVLGECASACTLVYVAGSKRWLGRKGELGFHRSFIPGEPLSLVPTAEDRGMGDWYAENGVSESFINRVLDTPANDLWTPPPDTLMSNGVSTDVWQ